MLAKIVGTTKIVPATVRFIDIAGIVAGASKGEGLGNKFLSHIREVDLICHVTRAFQDADVVHVAGDVDPKRDQEVIEAELILADLQTLDKQIEPRGKVEKEAARRWEIILRLKKALNEAKRAIDVVLDPDDRALIKDLQLLTMKPYVYVLNVSEEELSSQLTVGSLQKNYNDYQIIISAKIESELAGLSEAEQQEYLSSLGLEKSGLERLIQKAYQRLGLISFLTAGEKEARAWTIQKGTKAPQAASTIHNDFEKGFIKAEVISYDDFVSVGGWVKGRELGKVRLEGKEYIMQDGDVVDFKVNA